MPKLLSSDQIVKILEANGFEYVTQRGSHLKYRNKSRGKTAIIPAGKKEIPRETVGSTVNAVDPLGLFLSEQAVDNYLDVSAATGRTPRMGDIYRMPNEYAETQAQQFARKSAERTRCVAEEALEMAKDAALIASLAIPAS